MESIFMTLRGALDLTKDWGGHSFVPIAAKWLASDVVVVDDDDDDNDDDADDDGDDDDVDDDDDNDDDEDDDDDIKTHQTL